MSVQVDLLPVLEDKERQILLLRATQGMRDPFVTYVATVTIKQAADHASLAVVQLQSASAKRSCKVQLQARVQIVARPTHSAGDRPTLIFMHA